MTDTDTIAPVDTDLTAETPDLPEPTEPTPTPDLPEPTEPTPTHEELMAALVSKEPTSRQNDLVAYIAEQTGVTVDVEAVKLIQALTPEFRSDPAQVAAREARKAEREARKATAGERAEAKRLARAEKLRAQADAIEKGGPGRPKKVAPTETPAPVAATADASDDDDDDF
jgi:hypothetical protein